MRNAARALMGLVLISGAIVFVATPAGTQFAAVAPALTGLPNYRALEAKYPGSDAVVLFDSLIVSLDDGSRISKRRHRAVMLFTDNAINRYGDPRILFNAATGKLSVVAARVYMRDGTVVNTQKNGINQTTPFALDHAPDYADWQETVVTHVGIEKGCVAELDYVIRDGAPSPGLSGVEVFSSEDPVMVRVIEIRSSGASTVKGASLNGAPAPDRPAEGVLRWTVRDIEGRTPFNGGAWEGDCFPTVCYSTAPDWSGLLPKFAAAVDGKSRDEKFFAPIVKDATKDLRSDEDRILAVHRLTLDCVSSVHAPFGLFAAEPRDARRIYESGYAAPLDRAVLLMAMLRAAGYVPAGILASAGRAWTDEAPSPEIFNSVIVAVKTGDGELYIDPETALTREPSFGLAGRTLARLDGQYAVMHLLTREASESRSTLDLVLRQGPDSCIAGEGTAALTGLFSPYFALRGTGSEAEDFMKAHVGGLFGDAELAGWNPQRLDRAGAQIAFEFTVRLGERKPGERVYLAVPRPFEAQASGIDRVRLERSSSADAIRVEPSILETSCTIETPAGWKIVAFPEQSDVRNDIGSARVVVEPVNDGVTTCRRTLTIDRALVLPADYAKLRALVIAFDGDRLVLEKE